MASDDIIYPTIEDVGPPPKHRGKWIETAATILPGQSILVNSVVERASFVNALKRVGKCASSRTVLVDGVKKYRVWCVEGE